MTWQNLDKTTVHSRNLVVGQRLQTTIENDLLKAYSHHHTSCCPHCSSELHSRFLLQSCCRVQLRRFSAGYCTRRRDILCRYFHHHLAGCWQTLECFQGRECACWLLRSVLSARRFLAFRGLWDKLTKDIVAAYADTACLTTADIQPATTSSGCYAPSNYQTVNGAKLICPS